ncbi:(+)-neomenthol dehydrogenase-like [Dorcoceras hygrometricum]|uniref:(+)-neomenthol dehydrogenase-like n=1 Tax=Dorcoceras hygrometricum TaxID=472368 RepID=A0A2Z7B1U1_9LAMI|nr:(+)-neomenthol dehydrogenase-like [Dorcoceras hygrometricum]
MKSQQWISSFGPGPALAAPPSLSLAAAAAAAVFAGKLVSGQLDVENPFVLISSGLLVQPDEGVSDLVVDRIGVSTAIYREEPDYCNHGWSQAQVPER